MEQTRKSASNQLSQRIEKSDNSWFKQNKSHFTMHSYADSDSIDLLSEDNERET